MPYKITLIRVDLLPDKYCKVYRYEFFVIFTHTFRKYVHLLSADRVQNAEFAKSTGLQNDPNKSTYLYFWLDFGRMPVLLSSTPKYIIKLMEHRVTVKNNSSRASEKLTYRVSRYSVLKFKELFVLIWPWSSHLWYITNALRFAVSLGCISP